MPGGQCLNEIHGVKFVVESMGLCFFYLVIQDPVMPELSKLA